MRAALSKTALRFRQDSLTVGWLLGLWFGMFWIAAPVQGQETAEAKKKNVLIIYDERDSLPGLAVLDNGIRSGLLAAHSLKVEIYSENLDLSRFTNEDRDAIL